MPNNPSNAAPARLWAFALCVLFVAAAIISLIIRDDKSALLDNQLKYLAVVADLKAEAIRHFHQERLHDLNIYANGLRLSGAHRGALAGNAERRRTLETMFEPLFALGIYDSAAFADRSGKILLTLPAGAAAARPSARPAKEPVFLGMRRDAGGAGALDYEAAIDGGYRLLLRVDGDAWLSPLVEHWPGVEKTAETMIFQVGKDSLDSINQLRHRAGAAPVRIRADSNELAARAARGESGPILAPDYRGVPCYGIARNMPEIGWLLITKADEEELLSPLRARARLLVLAGASITALVGALLFIVIRVQRDRLRVEADAERRILATAIEQAGESVVITDKDGAIIYTNPAFTRASGFTREEARGRNPSLLKSGRHDASFYANMWETLARGDSWNGKMINRRKDGSLFEEDASITPMRDSRGAVTHYIAVKRDVSAVKSLEDQLFHSQKMEAIGRLAGGVAHDFNNILTTINGYAEMLAEAAPPDSQPAADLAEILGAGRRAALLTRQLLTFSRRAPADPVVVDLRALLRSMEKMLRRTLGEDVRLALDLPGEPLWVRTDPGQIDQVLMNLAVNARDAMPRGGTLTVRAHEAELATDEVRTLEVIPAGRYAVIVVADEGEGMDAAVLSRIFEPFFTTKEKGKGTGLGLATVFGIVKQNMGHISVDSAPGRGSTFTVHLPVVPPPAAAPSAGAAAASASARGDETILVVEDQNEVLRLVTRALTPQGYRVLACGGAREALDTARAMEGPIHLLLTDVVMPGMGGEELARTMRSMRPDTRVLYMSGYTDGRLDGIIDSGEKADLLLKPFTGDQICRRVRDALDGAPPRVA